MMIDSLSTRNNLPPKKWTVLVYSAADNNLHPFMVDDVAEMEQVGSDANTNLCVQIDHGREGNGAQRLFLQKPRQDDPNPHGPIHTRPEEELGQVNMSSADTLSGSIQWAMKKYPAEHYMLVISDHGNSWKGCCEDDSSMGWMDMPTLKSALVDAYKSTGKRFDVIGFDACMMANTEVAYELKDQARYLVASEQTEGGDGWPYTPILGPQVLKSVQKSLHERIDLEPEQLARMIVDKASHDTNVLHTLSAVDLSRMDGLKDKMTGLRTALVESSVTQETLRDLIKQCQHFFGYRDLGHFVSLLQSDPRVADQRVKDSAAQVAQAYQQAVMASEHGPECPNATGLTIHLTKPNDYYTYLNLDFQKDTDWVAVGNKIGPP